ncbi:hypothetical protein PN462_08970 [Spirulina sp. CS-785/01]|nr:hypothetical protein [Spirulina sp. CS-785/01]MDB9313229.1 hypothetical protein [Spirulina sp. CS-785/01]
MTGTGILTAPKSITDWLGDEADNLLNYEAKVSQDQLNLPSGDVVDRIFTNSDRTPQVLRSLQQIYSTGRLANTGYLSILPVDQGVEHSGGASFAPNPMHFDPDNIVRLALEGGCNAVATTLGVLGMVSRKYAHRIPFIVKLNHNETLTYPNGYDQLMFAQVEQAWKLGATAVGATIYFGSPESGRQIQQKSRGTPPPRNRWGRKAGESIPLLLRRRCANDAVETHNLLGYA